VGNSSAPT
jgi:hypothetical protein